MRTRIIFAALSALFLSVLWPAPAQAQAWSSGSRLCTHTSGAINETSGLSRSTYQRKVMFLHNDSGDSARFFAVSRKCKVKAVISVRDVRALDWEDMASGPDHTLWFGDIGDNAKARTSITVTKVKEPKELRSRSVKGTTYTLAYPDGAHDAEAMMIRPKTGTLYIVSKDRPAGAIYRAPAVLDPNRVNVLTKIATAPDWLTGADFARKGGRFVLRGYNSVYIYSKMGATPTKVRVPAGHTFGEAVAWHRNSTTLILGGEGVGTSLWRLK